MTDTRSEARQRHAEHLRSKASVMAREEAKAAAAAIRDKKLTKVTTQVTVKKVADKK